MRSLRYEFLKISIQGGNSRGAFARVELSYVDYVNCFSFIFNDGGGIAVWHLQMRFIGGGLERSDGRAERGYLGSWHWKGRLGWTVPLPTRFKTSHRQAPVHSKTPKPLTQLGISRLSGVSTEEITGPLPLPTFGPIRYYSLWLVVRIDLKYQNT
jgi:hypothetical protein